MLIRNGANGILVPNEDEEALTLAMEAIITDGKRARGMGKNALNVGVKYCGNNVYGEWEQYILNIVQNKR